MIRANYIYSLPPSLPSDPGGLFNPIPHSTLIPLIANLWSPERVSKQELSSSLFYLSAGLLHASKVKRSHGLVFAFWARFYCAELCGGLLSGVDENLA